MLPPFPYAGGKARIAGQVAALLPEHGTYVELFFGGGSLLLAKPPSPREVVNDLNGDLVNFWRQLRDNPVELERLCALTPHSRDELTIARNLNEVPDTAAGRLERARRTFVALTQGRAASLATATGWRTYHQGTSMGRVLAGYCDRLAAVAARLAEVSIENKPAVEVIAEYARVKDALLMCDPPYLAAARRSGERRYAKEMLTEDEHQELAEALSQVVGAVVLIGYPSGLYDRLYDGWFRYEISAWTTQGKPAQAARTEVIWSNRPLAAQHTLFDDTDEDSEIGAA
jgi:DNA adenine methylase